MLGLPGSVFAARRRRGRAARSWPRRSPTARYTPDGTLVSRRLPGAVLHDVEDVARRCLAMANDEPVTDIDGGELTVVAESICVHGDSPGAVEMARAVRDTLTDAGVDLVPFAT